jgi:hypothetical protein
MRKWSKILVVALAVIVGLVYIGVRPFVGGGERTRIFCQALQPGTSLFEVQSLVAKRGYKAMWSPRDSRTPSLIVDERAFGRFRCQVLSENDRVVSPKYVFAD